jgi:hypothetical protein
MTTARRRIDVLVDNDDQTSHVAVGGGDERGALGVAVIALPQRHHGHKLGNVLPHASSSIAPPTVIFTSLICCLEKNAPGAFVHPTKLRQPDRKMVWY